MEPRATRPQFPKEYFMGQEERLLPWAEAEPKLRDARNYWVCTTSADGRPQAMPVWALWRDGAIWFSTHPESAKARNIAREPRVVVHLESGDDVVIVEGTADLTTAPDGLPDAYNEKYGWQPEPDGWFVVRPRTAYAWNEKDFPKSATRYAF